MATRSVVVLLLLCCCDSLQSLQVKHFYPYGDEIQNGNFGSGTVPNGVSTISRRVNLDVPIRFYNDYYNCLYVHADGIITFGKNPLSVSKLRHRKHPFPSHFPTIAPFYAPVSVRGDSRVSYRLSKEGRVLNRATADVRSSFYNQYSFNASLVFIATWSKVKHSHGKFDDKANTYQAVIITDGKHTFVLFNYGDEGIQWTKGFHVHFNGVRQLHGQAGFDAGDNVRFYALPSSGEKSVKSLSSRSNINKPGQWIFRVGWPKMHGQNIQSADSYSPADGKNRPEHSINPFIPYQYLKGCFVVHTYLQANVSKSWNGLSVRSCMLVCHERNFPFVAIHNGSKCGCLASEDFLSLERAISTEQCNMTCSFDKENCGGKTTAAVYNAVGRMIGDDGGESLEHSDVDECAVGSSRCHKDASCVNTVPGYCCRCKANFIGNGISCVRKGAVERIIGDVSGRVNNVDIKDLPLLITAFTNDGPVYASIRYVPETIGYSLRILTPLADIVGWMFGRSDKDAHRGVAVIGTQFTRNATVLFDTDQVLYIEQTFLTKGSSRPYGRVDTKLNGAVPVIRPGATITFERFKQLYKREGPGKVESTASVKYLVDGKAKSFILEQVIFHDELRGCPILDSLQLNGRVFLSSFKSSRYEKRKVLGVAIQADLTTDTSGNVDGNNGGQGSKTCGPRKVICHKLGTCVEVRGQKECRCNRGYLGDGIKICQDADECQLNADRCHDNAECRNTVGSYTCTCSQGYSGDGYNCVRVSSSGSCSGMTCNRNARCDGDRCVCNTGFQGDGQTCNDIDECRLNRARCNSNADCYNTVGSYQCRCKAGYTGDGLTCKGLNSLCGGYICHSQARCINYRGQNRCFCNSGYFGNGIDECRDLDECSTGQQECDGNADCRNTVGSYQCTCRAGFTGNGIFCTKENSCGGQVCHRYAECTVNSRGQESGCKCKDGFRGNGLECQDVNECAPELGSCDPNADCINTLGSFECRCRPGYKGNGRSCIKDDSCNGVQCDSNATCVRQRCVCNAGYLGNGRTCNDIDECAGDHMLCDANADCVNTVGSHLCRCRRGFTGDGRRCISDGTCGGTRCDRNARCDLGRCVCNVGFQGNGERCLDVNECQPFKNRCHPTNGECVNTEGSYLCRCRPGFQGDGFNCRADGFCSGQRCDRNARCDQGRCVCSTGYQGNGQRCFDVNECQPFRNRCHPTNGECVNTVGSYLCRCRPGFQGDGFNCRPDGSCGGQRCDREARCEQGRCICNNGFQGNGLRCDDIDECSPGSRACDVNADCANAIGSYQCRCRRGFTGDGRRCVSDGSCNGVRCDRNARCDGGRCVCNVGFQGNGIVCDDTNECRDGSQTCDPNADCLNVIGSYQCQCRRWFTGDGRRCVSDGTCNGVVCDSKARCRNGRCVCNAGYQGDGRKCDDFDECQRSNFNMCDVNAQCINTRGRYYCRCKPGYRGNGYSCNEDGTCAGIRCDVHANCTQSNTNPSLKLCVCHPGWEGNGLTCLDIDECKPSRNRCHISALCVNTQGSFSCSCRPGFQGDGFDCKPDGTCAGVKCDANSKCIQVTGVIPNRCVCVPGYTGDGRTCTDINECQSGSSQCHADATCKNTAGSYTCKCKVDFKGDGINCYPDDTCGGVVCHGNAVCLRAIGGGKYCSCKKGFIGDGVVVCKDINECSRGLSRCDLNAVCINQEGGYRCRCNRGFQGDGFFCQNDGTCDGDVCDFNAECVSDSGNGGRKTCRCKTGFAGNGFTCADKNECMKDVCPENSVCYNTKGSFLCMCIPGYQKSLGRCKRLCKRCLNGGTCVGIDGCACSKGFSGKNCQWYGDASLVFTKGNSVQRLSLPPRPNSVGVVHQAPGVVNVGVDYDPVERKVYWTEIIYGRIIRSTYNGSDLEYVVNKKRMGSPEGIAVDWIGRNIYWTDSLLDVIEVAKLDGTKRTVLIHSGLQNPRAIIVDPPNGKMYWSDWMRTGPKVETANLDGSNRQILASPSSGLPNGLTLSSDTNELFYTDAGTASIYCIDLSRSTVRKVFGQSPYPFGITTFNRTLFWTDWVFHKVQQMGVNSKRIGTPLRSYLGSTGKLFDIKAVRPRLAVPNPCGSDNGGCDFLCLLKPKGYSCVCPMGKTGNGSHCQDIDKPQASCSNPLGMEDGRIPDSQLSASSAWDDNILRYGSSRARLRLKGWPPGWNAKKNDPNPWLQVDLGLIKTVTGVSTQGYGASQTEEWVKTYSLFTSQDGAIWEAYKIGDKQKIFIGNSDRNTVVRNDLKTPINTRWLRFVPKTWRNHISMRVEVYGC